MKQVDDDYVRAQFIRDNPHLCYAARRTGEERGLQIVKLGPLSRKASLQLVRGALGTEIGDMTVARIVERGPFDQLQMQRLKKRKLMLKDQISKIESELLPDIIA